MRTTIWRERSAPSDPIGGSARQRARVTHRASRGRSIVARLAAPSLALLVASPSAARAQGATSTQVARETAAAPDASATDGQKAPASDQLLATRLELELPLGCGSLAAFVDRLRARSARIRFTEQGANRTVLARVSAESNGTYRATMTLLYPDGHSSSRIIEASQCLEAVEALALVTAVALDPLSMAEPVSAPATQAPRAEVEAPSRALPSPAPRDVVTPPQTKEPTSGTPMIAVGVSFGAHHGPAPGWLSGFEPHLRWVHRPANGFSPSARLGVSYGESHGVRGNGGLADFAFGALSVDLCPLQFRLAPLELRACAVAHAGLVFSEGRATDAPESHRRQYLALGGSAEVAFLLSRSLAVPLRGLATFPLTRDSYSFSPEVFYRVPATAFGITAGLEVRFQ